MKRIRLIYFLSAISLLSTFTYAQQSTIVGNTKMVCLYTDLIYTKDVDSKPVTDSLLNVLQVGDACSKFEDYTVFLNEAKASQVKLPDELVRIEDSQINGYCTVVQNYPKGKMTVREPLYPAFYVYEEPMNKLSWTLKEDTMTVCGYLCKSAEATYGGRSWIAWYTEDIPSTSGPWKLNGLPGLILKAEDVEHTHCFAAYSLFHLTMDIKDVNSPLDQKISRDKFITYRNKIKTDVQSVKNPFYFIPVNSLKSVTVMKRGNPKIVINENFEFDYRHYYYIPLEVK